METSPERRPIAARETAWAAACAEWLAMRRVSANSISIAGMCCGILAGAAFVCTGAVPAIERVAWLLGATLVQARLLANLFDGMVAIRTQTVSRVGDLYNEIPDRVSDSATLIGLGYAAGSSPVLGWSAALAAVFVAYVRAQAKAAGAPNDFCGPMAKQHRMAVVTAVAVLCALLPTSVLAPIGTATGFGLPSIALALITLGTLLTTVRRIARAAAALSRGAE